jgi:hypothetical protein
MKTSFQRITPALVLMATLGFGTAHAQNSAPVSATSATPAVTKPIETGSAATHKRHVNAEKHHNSAKKSSDAVTAQTGKPSPTPSVTTPKS